MGAHQITRREFAQWIVVGGVGLAFVGCRRMQTQRPLSPQWWLELHADGQIRMLTKRVEMGQGAHTGLRTLIAEELDVSPESIDIVQVPSDPEYGEIITGGSFTLAGWSERMRRAGATARHMLRQAAAERWNAPFAEVTTFDAHLNHEPSGRRLPYRECVSAAAASLAPPPETVALKPPHAWRYIGKPGPIAWHREIVQGTARYGVDVRLPGMCFAVLARAPVLGARLVKYDDATARRTPGFLKTIALAGNTWPNPDHCRDAVAVIAKNSWAAQRARAALIVEWDRGPRADVNTVSLLDELESLCARPGVISHEHGNVDAARMGASRQLEALYRQPWLAHAPLEPPNATARVVNGRVEVWCGNQRQTRMKDAIVRTLDVKPEDVVVHASLIGGSFGRRLEIDYGVEAARLASELHQPVQVLWTREDDLKGGLYRSGSVHRLAASLDHTGRLRSFEHRYAAESVLRQQQPEQITEDGADWTLAAPLVALLYETPHARLEHRTSSPMTPCAWWRGTYWTHVTTAVECFMDELARISGQDPLAFRLAHLVSDEKREFVINNDTRVPFDPVRMRRVLNAVAERAGWSSPIPDDHARGLACGIYDSPECHAAVIAEMALRNGAPTLVGATVAIDIGTVVNPEVVRSQVMGGFVMGASAVLKEQITWRNGSVEQNGFHDYPIMRMDECPPIEVVIVASDAGFCGVGEIVTPAAMAAVSNAASRLLGRPIRSWPILQQS
ncbi:MAG: molybdopterin cofactor-binding domain-containing protein [Steroidobacter sp.]